MGIDIRPIRSDRIAVTGDIDVQLRIPDTGIEDRFWIATSDGSRILGTPDRHGRIGFRLVDEGAALVHITDDRIVMEWRMDWITIAGFYEGAQPRRTRSDLAAAREPAHA
ncbi:hypothetical protein [Sphingomonas prati]|uniref:Uncharacterized protein n=1 Tax=Sphingomonas prati TaxID=1843237 RepID=A0A7W9F261_9SPHN|nr:hypothetical protein [Sphingomonas prati]MBB5728464.1 hypothetical protein [Sphingomonas prati]GGE73581.1 hypothetical protein GCM10011404_02630 [Sphingomonas prati]